MTPEPHLPRPEPAPDRGLEALTDWVLAHKRTVAGFWIVLTIAGFWGAGQVTDALDDQFSMPSTPRRSPPTSRSRSASARGGEVEPLVAVAELPEGTTVESPGVRGDLRALEAELAEALPGSRIASYGSTGEDAYVSDDGRTTFAVVHPKIDGRRRSRRREIEPETSKPRATSTSTCERRRRRR